MRKILSLLSFLFFVVPVHAQLIAVATSKPTAVSTGINLVGSVSKGSTNGTDSSLALNYTPTVGNCVLIFVGTSVASTITSVTDNASPTNTYPLIADATNGNGGVGGTTIIKTYGLCNIPNAGTSITISFTSGIHIAAAVLEYANAFLGQRTLNGSAGAVTTNSTTVITQAANNYQVSSYFSFSTGTPAATGGATIRQSLCPSGCTTTFSGDIFVVADNTTATAGTSLTNSITTSSGTYAAASVELSTSSFNVVQMAAGAGTSTSVSFLQPTAVGDYVIAAIFDGSAASVNDTITDSSSNSYTQISIGGHTFCNMATDGDTLAMSYAKVTTGSTGLGVTVSGAAAVKRVYIIELNGMAASSVLDQVSSCTDTLAVTTLTTGSVTTTSAKEIIIPIIGSSNFSTYTLGTNYILLNQFPTGANSGIAATEVRLVGATGSYTGSMTINNSSEMTGFLATFKAQ